MAIDLSKVGKRETLLPLPNRKAYWQRLRPGCFVGFRPASNASNPMGKNTIATTICQIGIPPREVCC